MTPEEKLKILGASAKHDISCCGGRKEVPKFPGLYYASGSKGKIIPILKTLFTNKCKNNCSYCLNRASQNCQRVSFNPEELARLFSNIYQKSLVEGLFLSSGIDGTADKTMQQMIKTAELLRFKHHFRGFLHLKILPGSSDHLIKRAMRLATRVSINIEAPTPKRLEKIAKGKNFMQEIVRTMEIIKNGMADQTTQFVVGASDETDQEIIKTMDWLRRTKRLNRTYFSAFRSQNLFSTKGLLHREHRLYQVEFLQRLYGFSLSEIYFSNDGKLPNNVDPKLNYALHNSDKFPIEINKASPYQLLRIPGIGKITTQRILDIRRNGRFTDVLELKKIGAITQRAAPFILINGKRPEYQLSLVEPRGIEPLTA